MRPFPRRSFPHLVLLLAGASSVAHAAWASSSTQVRIEATVMRHASVSVLRAPASIAISAEDLARGYVDLSEPIEVAIRTNAPEGVLLGLALRTADVRSVLLNGEAGLLRVARAGATLPIAKQGRGLATQIVRLQARLELSAAAVVGPIAFPIRLFVTPN